MHERFFDRITGRDSCGIHESDEDYVGETLKRIDNPTPLRLEERQVGERLELLAEEKPGFWEQNGYHIYGDPWKEQRYSFTF